MQAIPFTTNTDPNKINKEILENPEKFLMDKLTGSRFGFGVDNITKTGFYKEMGFQYNLRPYLQKFIYKQYGQWQEMYALNKTNLRKLVFGKVEKIISI